MKALFVYLDDERPKPPSYDIIISTAEEAIDLIKKGQVAFISLDNDLGEGKTEGHKVADFLEELYFTEGIFIPFKPHTNNPSAYKRMSQVKEKIYRDYMLKNPDKVN